jgi:hypothetical protein
MIPQSIQNLLTELDRLEYVAIEDIPFDVFAPLANGISDANSIESYTIKIEGMLQDFYEVSETLNYRDLRDISNSLKKSILKLNNFRRAEEYLNYISDYEANAKYMSESDRYQKKLKLSACKLCRDVYNKQFDTLDKAAQWIKDLLSKIDPNKEDNFDQKLLIRVNEKFDYNRIIQRLTNTLQSEKLIHVDFGGNANNLKLIFSKFNPNFIKPEPIKWYADYDKLSFFMKTISDLGFIDESKNAKVNHYTKGCYWFRDEDGNPFDECKDKSTQRYTGRPEKYEDFYNKIKGDVEAAKE